MMRSSIRLLQLLAMVAVFGTSACGNSESPDAGPPPSEVAPFNVLTTSPEPGSIEVARAEPIVVVFNAPVGADGASAVKLVEESGRVVPTTVEVSGTRLTVTPNTELAYDTAHSLVLDPTLKDTVGRPLGGSEYTAEFRTLDLRPFDVTIEVRGTDTPETALPFSFTRFTHQHPDGSRSETHDRFFAPVFPTEPQFLVRVDREHRFSIGVRSFGYRGSSELAWTSDQLFANRDSTPVLSIALKPERANIELDYVGSNDDGTHGYEARILESAFIDEGHAAAGVGPQDRLQYVIGFTLMVIEEHPTLPGTERPRELAPNRVDSVNNQMNWVPYDSNVYQTRDGYLKLRATLTASAEDHAVIRQADARLVAVVYVEMLMLDEVEGPDEFLGFESTHLHLDTQQVQLLP
ncbi:MAG: Ig-like domain-containing protein [Myxococcota bacterium]